MSTEKRQTIQPLCRGGRRTIRRRWDPDERSDIQGLALPKKNPARRFAPAGYKLTAAGRAQRRQRAVQAHRQTLPRAADVAGAGEGGDGGLTTRRLPWPCALV